MKSTWNLGRLGGVDSSPHWSFLIVLFWVALTSLAAGAALALAVEAAFFILAVFAAANLSFMALFVVCAKRLEARVAKHETANGPSAESPFAGLAGTCSFSNLPPAATHGVLDAAALPPDTQTDCAESCEK